MKNFLHGTDKEMRDKKRGPPSGAVRGKTRRDEEALTVRKYSREESTTEPQLAKRVR